MDRRLLIFGGAGILSGITLIGYLGLGSQRGSMPAQKAEAGRPTLVFVGHDL